MEKNIESIDDIKLKARTSLIESDISNTKLIIDELKKYYNYDDEIAEIESQIYYYNEQFDEAIDVVKKGLKINPLNSNLYFILGNIYEAKNSIERAYLCYEQASFTCRDERNILFIKSQIDTLLSNNVINVKKLSFVILTFNQLDYTKLCIDSIRANCKDDTYEIVIVDNNSTDGTVEWLKDQKDIKVIFNEKNEGFPKGCNQGIEIANKDNDIFLLNNDTIIMQNSIFNMRMALYSERAIGAVGAVSNYVSNNQKVNVKFEEIDDYIKFALENNVVDEKSYEQRAKLVGFAMFIKREVLDEIGLLDERFTPGNYEDDDLSIRIAISGKKLLLAKDSYIHHFGSISFKKDVQAYEKLLTCNREKFKEKWGFYIENAIKFNSTCDEFFYGNEKTILEMNCGINESLLRISNKDTNKDTNIYGIENNRALHKILQGYNIKIINSIDSDRFDNYFDLVIIHIENELNNYNLFKKIYKVLNNEKGRVLVIINEEYVNISNLNKNLIDNGYIKNNVKILKKYNGTDIYIEYLKGSKEVLLKKAEQYIKEGDIQEFTFCIERLNRVDSYLYSDNFREEINKYNRIKFILRRIDFNILYDKYELLELINDIEDKIQYLKNIVFSEIINKEKVLNQIAILFFEECKYEFVLPFLEYAYEINKKNNDTLFNISYVLNFIGEKEIAMEYAKQITIKNNDVELLINDIKTNR